MHLPSFQPLHAETEHHHLPSHGGHLSGEVNLKASVGWIDVYCCALKTTGDECLTCAGGLVGGQSATSGIFPQKPTDPDKRLKKLQLLCVYEEVCPTKATKK